MIPIQQDYSQQQYLQQQNYNQQQFENEQQQQSKQEISQQFVINLSSYLQPIKKNNKKIKFDLSHFFSSNHQSSQQIPINTFLQSIQNNQQFSTIYQSLTQNQSTLIQLDLSYNDLTTSDLQKIIKSLQQHQQTPFNYIKSLDLSNNKINSLKNILSNFQKLQQLHLQNNQQLTFQALSKLSIKKIKSLSKLHFSIDSLITQNYKQLNQNELTQKYKQFINDIKMNWPKFQQLIIYSSSQQSNQYFSQSFKQSIDNYAWQKTQQLQDSFIIIWR